MTTPAHRPDADVEPGPPVFRVFVSSPGDVAEERSLAERVLRRLGDELAGRLQIEAVIWEHEPLLATDTFQSQLRRPSETDVVVSILWARLGTRLPAAFRRPDGTRYDSGTEFEFEDAVEGFRRHGHPELLVYRKTAEPVVSLRDPAAAMAKLEQKRLLDSFVERWFHDREEGTLIAAFHPYDEPARFEELLETHLRKLITRRHREALDARTSSGRWSHDSPFRGLAVFDAEHAPIFFGRTRETAEVMHAIRARAAAGSAFVLILGMSGSGKSSLARAGVLPLLTEPGVIPGVAAWHRAIFHPSDEAGNPLAALVRACLAACGADAAAERVAHLAGSVRDDPATAPELLLGTLQPSAGLALVVDQMEELFTHPPSVPDDAERFVEALAALARSGRAWIVGTLRSDYYARCEALPALVELKEGEAQYHLLAPTPSEIAEIVAAPARMAGLRFEADAATGERLEQRLVDAASANPEGLPLLEFTLEELHKRRTPDGMLTLDAYHALGGVEGALATRAEEVWNGLDAALRGTLPAVLRSLVEIDARNRGAVARRTAPLARFDAGARALIAAFVDARLFTAGSDEAGSPTVSVAHEALLRNWPRVHEWVRENEEYLRGRARLEAAASLWREEGEAVERLLPPGKPLTDAIDLDTRYGADLPESLRHYVRLSRDTHARARQRRRRRVVAATGAVLLATTLFGAFSYVQWRRTESARAQAALQRTEALRASESLLTNGLQLGFPVAALSDDQLAQLQDVLGRLAATGYRDTVELLIHPGQFRVTGGEGDARLPANDAECAGAGCRRYPSPAEEAAVVARVTAQLRREVTERIPEVPVRIRGMPADAPWDPYPPADAAPSDWNAAARRNHRVIVLLAGG